MKENQEKKALGKVLERIFNLKKQNKTKEKPTNFGKKCALSPLL